MQQIRIGIIGAGANTRATHIPRLRTIEGVDIVAVANRTPESSRRAADALGIPKAHDDWLALVRDEDIDAVVIGTWPYMHCPITLAALAHGKHVLCEARMATNAHEAHLMLEASRARPDLVAQLVPAPHTLSLDNTIRGLISDGYLGDLLAVELYISDGGFIDRQAPLHWRQDARVSGLNALELGIWYEAIMRWLGPATRVMARARTFVPWRRTAAGMLSPVTVPDHLDVLADLACGAVANMRLTTVAGLMRRRDCYLFGSEATLHVNAIGPRLYCGTRDDDLLTEVAIPPERLGGWRVEEEFIGAIRGAEEVHLTRFEDGVQYMEFTEAVALSAQKGFAIDLPLLPS